MTYEDKNFQKEFYILKPNQFFTVNFSLKQKRSIHF